MSLPLIYIAALLRTGSTLLSELLSQIPHSFIIHEPHLGKNYFALQEIDAETLRSAGIEVGDFLKYRLPIAFLLRRIRFLGYLQSSGSDPPLVGYLALASRNSRELNYQSAR